MVDLARSRWFLCYSLVLQYLTTYFLNIIKSHCMFAVPTELDGLITLHCIFHSYDEEHPPQPKKECQNITVLSCDLTVETPSIHDVYYVAIVSVNGRFHGQTIRFKPLAHSEKTYLFIHSFIIYILYTILSVQISHLLFFCVSKATFGPPILSSYTTAKSLYVKTTLPLGPNGVSIADTITNSTMGPRQIYIEYTLKITSPKWAVQVSLYLNYIKYTH